MTAYVRKTASGFVLGNDAIEREISIAGGRLSTVAITNRLSGRRIELDSLEFCLLIDRRSITARELDIVSLRVEDCSVEARLESLGLEVVVRYEVHGDGFARKKIFVSAPGRLLDTIDVERARFSEAVELGGLGQPFFIAGAGLFLGLEYPAGHQLIDGDRVVLRHFPGRTLGAEGAWSKTAVLGAMPFSAYVQKIRYRPPRSFIVYTGFYDVQGADVNETSMIAELEVLHRELTAKRGIQFDAFCVDRGWANLRSIYEHSAIAFPHGLQPIAELCRSKGAELGLWLPLTPYHRDDPHVSGLDTHWGADAGYEVSPDFEFFCIAGARYRGALEQTLLHLVRDIGVGYLKHDYNYLYCSATDHGHLPTEDHSREAITDGIIEALELTRAAAPDVYLTPTSGMWLSPWWLAHCETVWPRHSVDWAYEKQVFAIEPRDWEMTYRDARMFQNLREDRSQFPLSAVMTLGIIDGRLNRLGGPNEPLKKWVDNAVLCIGRGTLLRELYLSPDLVTAAQWDALAATLRWGIDRASLLAEGEMILGNPARGEVYGYQHISGARALYCLRNPSIEDAKVTLHVPPGDGIVLMTYPYGQVLSAAENGELEVELPALAVVVIEKIPRLDLPAERFAIDAGSMRVFDEAAPSPLFETRRAFFGDLIIDVSGLTAPAKLALVTQPPLRAEIIDRPRAQIEGDGWIAATVELEPGTTRIRARAPSGTRAVLFFSGECAVRASLPLLSAPLFWPPHLYAAHDFRVQVIVCK